MNVLVVGGHGKREVTRDDVAATLIAVLDEPQTIGATFELLNGDEGIAAAVARLADSGG